MRKFTEADAIGRLREACELAGSQPAWGRANDFSTSYVNNVLHRLRPMSPRMLKALGLELAIVERSNAAA